MDPPVIQAQVTANIRLSILIPLALPLSRQLGGLAFLISAVLPLGPA
jgi:hypothetical protein